LNSLEALLFTCKITILFLCPQKIVDHSLSTTIKYAEEPLQAELDRNKRGYWGR
jgi:hypothetical protein